MSRRQPYEPALSPRLRILLALIFAGVALLGATGVYLLAIRLFEWSRSQAYTNQFTLWMFVIHVVIGVALAVPLATRSACRSPSTTTRNSSAAKTTTPRFL